MARKTCPECRRVTAASATSCPQCGHAYATSSIVVAPRRAKRCAMCGIINTASASECPCGFEFDQPPAELHAFYRRRRREGIAMTVLAIGLGVVATGALLFLALFGFVGVVVFCLVTTFWIALIRRGLRIARAAGDNLAELDGKTDALPVARVVTRETRPS